MRAIRRIKAIDPTTVGVGRATAKPHTIALFVKGSNLCLT